ncbi:MAG: aspartyl protease family protein [Pyrinomonadaceae bacterium]
MKSGIFLTGILTFSFRKKRLINLFLICFFIIGIGLSVRAEERVSQVEAQNAKQLLKLAEKLSRRGEMVEAEKVLRRIIEAYPLETKAKLNLAYILQKQRRLLEAYNLSFEVAKADSKNSFAFAVLGATFLNAGNFKDAKLSYHNALLLNKKEALAWAGLGTLDFYENRISLGLENLRAAVYYEFNNPEFLFTLAQIATRAEKYTEAAEAYDRFLQVSPETDSERRDRIKGLINFLRFLGNKPSLYNLEGSRQTSVSFKLVNNRPIIQLKVNEKDEPLNFVLDTGSGISVISKETAERFNVKSITRGGLARALGGNGKFEIVYGFLRSISIGDVRIRNVPVYIRQFHNRDEKIDGYIGLALISKFLTTVDYGNSTFALEKKVFTPNNDQSLSLPLRLTSSGFLSGEVEVEGVDAPLNFIVDTGASVSVISDEIANNKEISRFIKAEKMRVIGAAGVTEDVSSFILPRVSFGTHSRERVTAIALDLDIINEASGFVQAGILGGNFLKNYILTFDFENSKVIFVPIKK